MDKDKNQSRKSINKIVPITLFVLAGLILIANLLFFALHTGQEQAQTTDAEGNNVTVPETTASEVSNEENKQNTEEDDSLFSAATSEEGDTIAISTRYGRLEYPAAFSDVIQIQTETSNDVSTLRFVGDIGDDKAALFDVCYGETEGEFIRQIQLNDGSKISVFLVIYDPPQNMTSNDLNTFYAAQEVVNNIIASIMEE